MAKERFTDICERLQLSVAETTMIMVATHLPRSIINSMLLGEPVPRDAAQAVLTILSFIAHEPFTLDSIDIPVL